MPEDCVTTPLSSEPLSCLAPYSLRPKIESGKSTSRTKNFIHHVRGVHGSCPGKLLDRTRKVHGSHQEYDYPNKIYFIFHETFRHISHTSAWRLFDLKLFPKPDMVAISVTQALQWRAHQQLAVLMEPKN
jgi:hypothetical protein